LLSMGESCSISLDGSQRLKEDGGWDGVIEKRTKELNLKGPSQYFQYLAEKDIYESKGRIKNREFVMFCLIVLTFLALVLQITGVL